MAGAGVAEGIEKGIEKGASEAGAAVVDVGTRGQAGQVGVAVRVGQVGEARTVTGDVDTAATDGVGGWVCAA
ncbi:hypothetical protein STENM223S_07689 [Streptomyces tendae]